MSLRPPGDGRVTLTIDGVVATLTLSNPGKLNGVSLAMWDALRAHCEALSANPALRCVIVRGADGNFAAGGDLAEFPAVRATLNDIYAYHVDHVAPALRALADCLHPTIALIDGVCIGGGLLVAAHCDLRIAAASSRFGAPIKQLGFAMAPEEMRGLLALLGPAVVTEILLEGRLFDAQQAQQKGLVTRVVADGELAHAGRDSAARIASGAPLAARANKQTIRRLAAQMPTLPDDEVRRLTAIWAESEDYREGIAAFLDKRTPVFNGC